MIEDNFPDFYRRADAYAVGWQKRYLWSQKVQLGALLAAAAVSAVGDYPGAVVFFFGLAIVGQLYQLVTRADERWWNGRAGAESAKTAAWLYISGGVPFQVDNASADVELASRLSEVASKVADMTPVPSSQSPITPEMAKLRSEPLSTRVDTYHKQRIQDQCSWYAKNSERNGARARQWSTIVIIGQGIGLLFGIVAALNEWKLDVVTLFAAICAAALAWLAVKQYGTLARSYAVASTELASIGVEISSGSWSEDRWAAFVNAAEEAISREHTSWRASKAV